MEITLTNQGMPNCEFQTTNYVKATYIYRSCSINIHKKSSNDIRSLLLFPFDFIDYQNRHRYHHRLMES